MARKNKGPIQVGDVVTQDGWDAHYTVVRVEGAKAYLEYSYQYPYPASTLTVVKRGKSRGFKPGIDGEVNEAERRSAQLRSLRSLANKLGYTLVKNDQEVTA